MFGFLKKLVKHIPIVGDVVGIAGGVKDLLGGNQSPVLSNRDFQRQQDQLDQANPREIARQGRFLTGVAPAEAEAHNIFQEATYGEDTQRQKERLDTLFPGTSPWERLGSSAGGQLQGPSTSGDTSPGAAQQFLASVTQSQAAIQAAKINQRTAIATETIRAGTARDVAETTAGPANRQATLSELKNETEIALMEAGINLQTKQAQNIPLRYKLDAMIADRDTFTKVLPYLPKRIWKIGPFRWEDYPDIQLVLNGMSESNAIGKGMANAIQKIPERQWQKFNKDASKVIYDIVNQGAESVSRFLQRRHDEGGMRRLRLRVE